jgi:hypothetical protein
MIVNLIENRGSIARALAACGIASLALGMAQAQAAAP